MAEPTARQERQQLVASLRLHVRSMAARGQRTLPAAPEPQSLTSSAPPAGADSVQPPDLLGALAHEVTRCQRCRLHQGRTNAVPGEGDPSARLLFVGEGPGFDEDRTGRPFVGPAGRVLDAMIGAMGLRRSEVYIANVVKCRPPGNRQPQPDEVACCWPYLEAQVRHIQPEVIVLLGATALRAFYPGPPEGLRRSRGRWRTWQGIPVLPTFHPAYLLRNEAEKLPVWEDLKAVLRRLDLPIPHNPADG